MELTREQRDLLPTEDDIAFFRDHGYFVSGKIFSDGEIEEAVDGVERFYAGERDFCLPSSIKAFEGWKPGDGEGMRFNDYVSLQCGPLFELVRHPLIGMIAARLNGSSCIRLWHDQLIYKPVDLAGSHTSVGWHHDLAYWQTCTSTKMLTCWIPLHDCDERIGPLTVVDGSHRWPHAQIAPGSAGVSTDSADWSEDTLRGFHRCDGRDALPDIGPDGRPVVRVPLLLKQGQVSFHQCRTIHGSGPNRSDRPRLSLSVHLQDGENRYRAVRATDGGLVWHRNDMLCRTRDGQPDYTDPDFCPVLWQEPARLPLAQRR